MRTLFTVVAMAALMAAGTLAQDNMAVRASVPFDFMVGDQRVPAGDYTITRGPFPTALRIFSKDGETAFTVLYHNAGVNKTSYGNALVFHTYNDQHFLKEVWTANGTAGAQLPKSKGEKELIARQLNKQTVAVVVAQ